jgi:hypothetical protein
LPIIALVVSACSGAKPKQFGEENNFDLPPQEARATESSSDTPPSESSAGSSEGSSLEAQSGLNPDQKKQMEIALRRGGDKAANCAEVVPDAPSGQGDVKVVFDGRKGRVTDVLVGPPFAGTPVEACVKRAFIGEIVLPFEGEPLEVPYNVKLPPKKGGPVAPKKK